MGIDTGGYNKSGFPTENKTAFSMICNLTTPVALPDATYALSVLDCSGDAGIDTYHGFTPGDIVITSLLAVIVVGLFVFFVNVKYLGIKIHKNLW